MAAPAVVSLDPMVIPLPKWETPVKCGRITRIRTVEVADFPAALKTLQVWKNIYAHIPKDISEGSHIADRCFFRFGIGKVLVAEDSRGVAGAFARVRECYRGLYIEELVVAPWNNTPAIKYTKSLDWMLPIPDLKELADIHEMEPKDLLDYKPYTGTVMMYGVYLYAKFLEKEKVALTSLRESCDFYAKLDMEEEDKTFTLKVAEGLPKGFLERMRRNFPDEISGKVHPLKC